MQAAVQRERRKFTYTVAAGRSLGVSDVILDSLCHYVGKACPARYLAGL